MLYYLVGVITMAEYKCPECGKVLATPQGLRGHMMWQHKISSPVLYKPVTTGDLKQGLAVVSGELKQATSGLSLAIGDLCEDCQDKLKDKLFEQLPDELPVAREGTSSSGGAWLALILLGLAWAKSKGYLAPPGGQTV